MRQCAQSMLRIVAVRGPKAPQPRREFGQWDDLYYRLHPVKGRCLQKVTWPNGPREAALGRRPVFGTSLRSPKKEIEYETSIFDPQDG